VPLLHLSCRAGRVAFGAGVPPKNGKLSLRRVSERFCDSSLGIASGVHGRLNRIQKVIFVAPKRAFFVKIGAELPKMSAEWHDKMSSLLVFSITFRLPTSFSNIFFSTLNSPSEGEDASSFGGKEETISRKGAKAQRFGKTKCFVFFAPSRLW
jgi:hypothetical protein